MGMQAEEEWVRIRGSRSWPHEAGVSLIRFALLFGVVAVAFALILVPVLDDPARGVWSRADGPIGVDPIETGQIRAVRTYTERRSVLQATPNSVCVIRDDGGQSGDC
ncbi:MAG: hypothetical protein ABWZ57_13090 [Mesorhizobium sp.]|jgi:hypothetical protein